jgi:hypothetical protein
MRSIPEAQYRAIAAENQDALDYPKVLENHKLIHESKMWVIIQCHPDYRYIQKDGYRVKEHYLIIPKDNSRNVYTNLTRDEHDDYMYMRMFLKYSLAHEDIVKFEEKDRGRSIKKFHIHCLVLDGEEVEE